MLVNVAALKSRLETDLALPVRLVVFGFDFLLSAASSQVWLSFFFLKIQPAARNVENVFYSQSVVVSCAMSRPHETWTVTLAVTGFVLGDG